MSLQNTSGWKDPGWNYSRPTTVTWNQRPAEEQILAALSELPKDWGLSYLIEMFHQLDTSEMKKCLFCKRSGFNFPHAPANPQKGI